MGQGGFFMIGYVQWTQERTDRRLGEISVLRMRFCRADLRQGKNTPEPVMRRRAASLAAKLHKLDVSRAVFPENFPYMAPFLRRGVLPVDPLEIYRALAADWIWAEMRARGIPAGGTVAVSGERLSGQVARTVTELSLRNRYVLLDVPYGGEELARQLRREYGVSLLLSPAREQMESADVLALFAPREELSRKNPVVLPLYEGAKLEHPPVLRLPPALEERVPHGCCRNQLFAALMEAGVLRPGQIEVVPTAPDT